MELLLFNLWDRDELPFPVEPCSSKRDWVKSAGGWPYKCLPLKMAGEAGWALLSPVSFTASWNGGRGRDGLRLQYKAGSHFQCVSSDFGLGVLTFNFPYLFRTPPGINLWVRGPANWFIDGIQAMEGLVETDWADAKFTMNWKFTRANHSVHFRIGDPICVITPFPRGFLESFAPRAVRITEDSPLDAAYSSWSRSRRAHIQGKAAGTLEPRAWQKTYFRGLSQEEEAFSGHQLRLGLAPFTRRIG